MLQSYKLRDTVLLIVLTAGFTLHTCGQGSAQELRRSGFLGVVAVQAPDAARRARSPGVLVRSLVEGGSAKAADIRPDDIITQVNDHKVSDVNDFVQAAKNLRAGAWRPSACDEVRRSQFAKLLIRRYQK